MTRALPEILLIDSRRVTAGIKIFSLCAEASFDERGYRRQVAAARGGRDCQLHRRSLDRLDAALVRLQEGRKKPAPDPIIAAFYRLAMRNLAALQRRNIEQLMTTDFSVQRPKNRQWLAAVRIRRFAIYLTVVEFDLPSARIARAIGCTRANVSQALRQVTDLRDDPRIDALLDRCARMAKGEGA